MREEEMQKAINFIPTGKGGFVFLTPEQGQAASGFRKNHPRFAPVFFRKTLHRLNTHLLSLWNEIYSFHIIIN